MSDVKRTLKVIGIIGALECLFLQEVSEAREDEAHGIFARPDSVLLAGPRQDARPQVERNLSSAQPVIHSAAPSNSDTFPTRPIASEPAQVAPATQAPVMDAFPRYNEQGELAGRVEKQTGNFMASRGEATTAKSEPVTTKVYIFKGKIESGLRSGELKTPALTDPRAIVVNAVDGAFKTRLPAGTYTVFIEVDGKLYNNVFDADGHFSTIEIKQGQRTEANIRDTSQALF